MNSSESSSPPLHYPTAAVEKQQKMPKQHLCNHPCPLGAVALAISKQDEQGGKAALTPAIPSITFAAVNAAITTAVAPANPRKNPAAPSAPAANAEALVHSTLPAGVAPFPASDIMPTAALAPTINFATSEAVVADVSVATGAAYSTLGVTIADDAKMGV